MRLSPAQRRLLLALAQGKRLQSHRHLNGRKRYLLHSLAGEQETVHPQTVQSLYRRGLIYTNHKFPAATYSLTEAGRAEVR